MNKIIAPVALLSAVLAAALTMKTSAQAAPKPSSPEFFTARVAPILQANCAECHQGSHHRGGLSMNNKESLLKGGEDGPVIVPGHPEQSLLVKLIRQTDLSKHQKPMPPKGKLSDDDIHTIEQWIRAL